MKHTYLILLLSMTGFVLEPVLSGQQADKPAGKIKQYRIDASKPDTKIYPGNLNLGGSSPDGDMIELNNFYMKVNDEPIIPVMGEFHYSRYPHKYWEEEIKKMKAGGITIIPTYVFWNIHEEEEGVFDWTGDRNLRRFVELCAKNNVWTIVRLGPYCHGEIRNGGLPDWLYGRPFQVRSMDEGFLFYVDRLYKEIGNQLEGLLFKDGGPIIGFQLENEYQHSASPWSNNYYGQPVEMTVPDQDEGYVMEGVGSQSKNIESVEYGTQYMQKLKEMAIKAGLTAPLYTATGWGYAAIVENEMLPVTAAYAYPNWSPIEQSDFYLFKDIHRFPDYSPVRYTAENYPSICAELSGGMIVRYSRRPVVPPNSLEALIVRTVGSGANGIGYYMYHGGSTPTGKHNYFSDYAYGYPYISYDFQAPIREYGQLNESFFILRTLHMFLEDFGSELAPMVPVLPEQASKLSPDNIETLRYAVRVDGNSGFVFMTNFQDHAERMDQKNLKIKIKLPDGEITIPENSSFTLKKNTSAILPFNLSVNGINLRYSTAQLLGKFDDSGETHFLFYEIDGIRPEFQFDKSEIAAIEIASGESKDQGNYKYCFPEAGLNSTMTIEKKDGTKVKLTTLTREQALQTWKINLAGKERVVISESVILENDGYLTIQSFGNNTPGFLIFPDVDQGFVSDLGSVTRSEMGIYGKYTVQLETQNIQLATEVISNRRITLDMPDNAFLSLHDIYLSIDYIGDTGMGFIDGKLVTDHFYYGEPWCIGLKRFFPEISDKGMYFYFRPIYPNAPYLMDLQPENIPDFSDGDVCEIKDIKVIPEYQVILKPM